MYCLKPSRSKSARLRRSAAVASVGGVLEVAHERAAVGQPGEAVGQRLVAARAQQAEVLAEEHAAAGAGDEQRRGGQQRGGEVHGRELADDEHGERDGGEGRGQRQRAAGDLVDGARGTTACHAAAAVSVAPSGHSVSTHEPAT